MYIGGWMDGWVGEDIRGVVCKEVGGWDEVRMLDLIVGKRTGGEL